MLLREFKGLISSFQPKAPNIVTFHRAVKGAVFHATAPDSVPKTSKC